VQGLLDAGADVNAEGSRYKGGAALWLAADAGHVEIIEMLLDARADVKAMSGNRGQLCTALQRAIRNGRSGAVEVLVNKEVAKIGLRCERLEVMTVNTLGPCLDGYQCLEGSIS
jgi:ankyrin repeat protein